MHIVTMIVVNSHKNYGVALFHLLESLRAIQYPMKNVIIVIGGSDRDDIDILGEDREVYIHVQNNCYDLTHAYGIYKHIDHPRVISDYYACIHDCCIAMKDFQEKTDAFLQKMRDEHLDVLYALNDRRLGLVGLSNSFMRHHGHNYYRTINKGVAWEAEHGRGIAYSAFVEPQKVSQCDCSFKLQPAIKCYDSDIYRHPTIVQSLGLIKFVANDGPINPVWQLRYYP